MVEWGGLENRCSGSRYRGFESHPLRLHERAASRDAGRLYFERGRVLARRAIPGRLDRTARVARAA